MKNLHLIFILFFYLIPFFGKSQCLTPVNFALQKSLPSAPTPSVNHYMTAHRDTFPSKPYLYVAAKELGLYIYNISSLTSPTLIFTIPTSSLGTLDVNNITQSGNYLYLSLGNIFNATAQASGMAIIDVSTPATPTVKSVYTFTANSGTSHIAIDGNFALLSAQQNGVIAVDITNKSLPVIASQLIPNVNFPKNAPNPTERGYINARSMVIKNNIIYLCYDAGGLRIINASNKYSLKETGRYSNPALIIRPRAYNNLVLNDSLLYVATDYAGMEILKIKDTANITLVSWWNPWKAQLFTTDWYKSPGHTNEIEFDPVCKMVFMAAGRSDIMAVSVVNPLLPDSCSQYGIKTDSNCTWGLGRYNNQIYLAYISTPWPWLFQPFVSTWSGVKILTYTPCALGVKEFEIKELANVYPNPVSDELSITNPFRERAELIIFDSGGKLLMKKECYAGESSIKINVRNFSEGIYFVKLNSGVQYYNSKFIISKN